MPPTLTPHHRRRYGSPDQGLVHARELTLTRRLLRRVGPAGVVLDAPSGYGRLAPLLRDELSAATRVSVDRDPTRLALIERDAGNRAVVCADLLAGLPLADASVDLALCFRFLQHLRGAEQRLHLLRELRRVCGGTLLLSYYRAGGPHELQQRLSYALGRRSRVLCFLGRGQLREEAARAGWTVHAELAPLPGLHAQRLALLR